MHLKVFLAHLPFTFKQSVFYSVSFVYAKQCDWVYILFYKRSLAEVVSIHNLSLMKGSKQPRLSHKYATLQVVFFKIKGILMQI